MSSPARRERLEEVAREVVEPVRRYLARRTDPATADDVLADTLLVCWRRIDEVPDDPLPWAYGVARRCLANAERASRRQRRVARKVAAVDPPAAAVPGPDDEPAGAAGEGVRRALAALPPADAELLRLWAWEGLAASEIAVVLDTTPNAVGSRLTRARQKLRDRLRKDGVPGGHGGVTERRTR
ncbi:RNA polymerase sigma factor [Nocardioides litoris]|uniref:RNA polymerase sigma factor n=1 Tax=Nocardioides litoris TaxID=1926648 RepID=UPI0011225356|nr:sigma-70 family RNA polymerase sigma factor [Nocardioides litoris]